MSLLKLIREEIQNVFLGEDYPSSFDMEHFKTLRSFNARIKYCQEHLQRLSSGTSRIVYKIDDEKVLKLARNKKGLAQNEIEHDYSKYYDIQDVIARVFDVDDGYLWIEMELARKLKKSDFKNITGFKFGDFAMAINNYAAKSLNRGGFTYHIDKKIVEDMWESEFTYDIFNFIGAYDVPVGDLMRPSSYGIVQRDGRDRIVIIDYGLTNDVYDSYYS